jgi:hypothetical protein
MTRSKMEVCRKGQHRFILEQGRRCARCGVRRTRMPGTPELVRLQYGSVYCELSTHTIAAGECVAWWMLGRRRAAYCASCHHHNLLAAKRGEPSPIRRAA